MKAESSKHTLKKKMNPIRTRFEQLKIELEEKYAEYFCWSEPVIWEWMSLFPEGEGLPPYYQPSTSSSSSLDKKHTLSPPPTPQTSKEAQFTCQPTKEEAKEIIKKNTILCVEYENAKRIMTCVRNWTPIRYIFLVAQHHHKETKKTMTGVVDGELSSFFKSMNYEQGPDFLEKDNLSIQIWSSASRLLECQEQYDLNWQRIQKANQPALLGEWVETLHKNNVVGKGWCCPELGDGIYVVYEDSCAMAMFCELVVYCPNFLQDYNSIEYLAPFDLSNSDFFILKIFKALFAHAKQQQSKQNQHIIKQENVLTLAYTELGKKWKLWSKETPFWTSSIPLIMQETKTKHEAFGNGSEQFGFAATPTTPTYEKHIKYLQSKHADHTKRTTMSSPAVVLANLTN